MAKNPHTFGVKSEEKQVFFPFLVVFFPYILAQAVSPSHQNLGSLLKCR